MSKILAFIAFALFLCQQGDAQDFVIVHDLQKDTTKFFKVGKEKDTANVSEISFRKPGRITLKVENFNPFYWNAKVTAFKKPVDEESGQIGLFIASLTKGLGISGFPSVRGGVDPQTVKRLRVLYSNLEEYALELQDLKYDVQQTEVEIKSETRKVGNSVMGLIHTDKLDPKEMRSTGKELDDSIGISLESPFEELLGVIAKTYNEIINSNYRFFYSMKGTPEINEIKLQIYPKSDSIAKENAKDTITKYFSLHDKASLKLRNSVGITFTYFQDKNRSYYVKPDLTIGSGSGDLFTPVISTFINFYSNKSAGFKWGGSFGFGIPLVGDRKDVNFMLGLCGVIGRNEAIILSAGVAGTRVSRLTDGWKVGQTVPSQSFNIPTLLQFRPGGFISIAFNVRNFTPARSDD